MCYGFKVMIKIFIICLASSRLACTVATSHFNSATFEMFNLFLRLTKAWRKGGWN